MSTTNLRRAIVTAVSCAIAAAALAQSDEWRGKERARERFLCQWKQANVHDSARALDFCSNADLDLGLSLVQQDGFWGDQPRALRMQFEADWLNSPELAEQARLKREAQARAHVESERGKAAENAKHAHIAADKRAQFDASVSNKGAVDLCIGLHDGGYESGRAELVKRKAFTAREWALIETGKIAIGMSQAALICSWGNARANRTLTANSERLQYIYGSGTYVYVVNGVVTSIQDTR